MTAASVGGATGTGGGQTAMNASDELYADALGELCWLFTAARRDQQSEPDAASLATVGEAGRPSVRTVSVAAIEEPGPVFFYDRSSGKGRQLAEDPRAALCFFWPQLEYQVIVEGEVWPLPPESADRIWRKRPRESKLAAWIAEIRPPPGKPDTVESRLAEARRRFSWDPVPRPTGWEGACLHPDVLDFWHLVWSKPRQRMHFRRDSLGTWRKELLQPF